MVSFLYQGCNALTSQPSEILSEIDLPQSGVTHSGYVHMFPAPPDSGSVGTSPASASSFLATGSARADEMFPQEQEQSWYYYLAEIALRHIGNRVLDCFYKEGHDSWMKLNIPSTIQVVNEFLRQLNQWYECLPGPVRFNETNSGEIPIEELPYMLRTRMLEIRSWIFRPLLFYAIHTPPHDAHQEMLRPLVDQSMHASVRLIEANSLRHRHHGTWYILRLSTTSALSIFAAAKRGLAPDSWQSSLELAIETLLYWEREAPGDIRKGRLALENLLSDFPVPLYCHLST